MTERVARDVPVNTRVGYLVRRSSKVVFLTLLSAAAYAQSRPAPIAHRVSGVVYDSIGGTPLASAIVQAVMIDTARGPRSVTERIARAFSTTSDASGRFELNGLPRGLFAVGFLHEVLNALGLESPIVPLELGADSAVRLDLAVPGGSTVRSRRCPRKEQDHSAAWQLEDGSWPSQGRGR